MKKQWLKFFSVALIAMSFVNCAGKGKGGIQGKIDGVDGPYIEYTSEYTILSMTFENLAVDGGATIPLPKFPNSTFQLGPDFKSGGTLLSVSISLKDLGGGQMLDPQTLPGGRPLPGVAQGQLPAIAFAVPQFNNAVLYVSTSAVGVFVPTTFLSMQNTVLTFGFNNSAGKRVGIVAAVGPDTSGANAGIFALYNISQSQQRYIGLRHRAWGIRSLYNP